MPTGWVRAWSAERDERQTAGDRFDVNKFRRTFKTQLRRTRSASGQILAELTYDSILTLPNGLEDNWTQASIDGQHGYVNSSHIVEIAYVATKPSRQDENLEPKNYILPLKAKKNLTARGNATRTKLLWGDIVQILTRYERAAYVRSRSWYGYVDVNRLNSEPLLEVYVIDVGQGDGVLVRDTQGRHILIDGGLSRRFQQSGKNAADFIDWKFHSDYGHHAVHLDAMVASHCDADHFGGLNDLISTSRSAKDQLDVGSVTVKNFYHAGLSYWKVRPEDRDNYPNQLRTADKKWLGPSIGWAGETSQSNGSFVYGQPDHKVDPKVKPWILGNKDEFDEAVSHNTDMPLGGSWGIFLRALSKPKIGLKEVHRLGVAQEEIGNAVFMPGWHMDETETPIRVLGPVTVNHNNEPTLPDFESNSQNTNGHSVLLRIDYGRARILMTGDLNKNSMDWLRHAHSEERIFQSDVAKGCHHGSSDISHAFLKEINAGATVISSGDAEGHAHPRPEVAGASSMTGFQDVRDDKMITPLLYMTEIERSFSVGKIKQIRFFNYPDENGSGDDGALFAQDFTDSDEDPELARWSEAYKTANASAEVEFSYQKELWKTKSGELDLKGARIMRKVHYGLVNVRTDGNMIMCATMKESGSGWTVHVFPAREHTAND